MVETAIVVFAFLVTAASFLLIGFIMGRKTYVAPAIGGKEEKIKVSIPFVEDIGEDPYALALTEDETKPKIVGSL